jgi:SAM-dependent methyltransferase
VRSDCGIGNHGSDHERQYAPAAARNSGPILQVLREELPEHGTILEVGSGTGQHVVAFAAALPALRWLPSDPDPDARRSIAAWTRHAEVANVAPPLDLDVARDPVGLWPRPLSAIVAINLVHISPWAVTLALLQGAGRALPPDGLLFLYGPFKEEGRHTSASNESFDRLLRFHDPAWGVRDLDEVAALAAGEGLTLQRSVAMPASNLSVLFHRIP